MIISPIHLLGQVMVPAPGTSVWPVVSAGRSNGDWWWVGWRIVDRVFVLLDVFATDDGMGVLLTLLASS